jgi:hypothetical protein
MIGPEIKHNLLMALRTVLRPLVRIAIRQGVMHADLAKELRTTCLEVAREVSIAEGREPSEMRLRMMTGMSTADLRMGASQEGQTSAVTDGVDSHTLAAMVLSTWHAGEKYAVVYGVPIELPLRAKAGQPSIEGLVRAHDANAEVELVVERLLAADCIRKVDVGRYAVTSRIYMPATATAEGMRYFGEATARYVATLEHNLLGEATIAKEKRLERAVFADHGIPVSRLAEFQDVVKKQWDAYATPIDNWLNAPPPTAESENEEIVETGVCVYHYVVHKDGSTEPKN